MNRSLWISVVFAMGGLYCLAGEARVFYVDSVGGNDSRSGLSDAKSWKTISKVVSSHFIVGDTILFKRGGIWRETLLLEAKSGNSIARISFGAYGDGERPVITGSDPVTGWTETSPGSHIWRASLSWTPILNAEEPDLVFFDGERGLHRDSVAKLTKAGDWYWVPNTLSVYSESSPEDVQVAARDFCIQGVWNGNSDYITIEDLELKNANHHTLCIYPSNDNWVVRNVVMHHAGRLDPASHNALDKNGLSMTSVNNNLVTQCVLYESGGNNINVYNSSNIIIEKTVSYDAHHHCIDFKGGPASPTGNIIRYNVVYCTPGFSDAINGIALIAQADPNLLNTLIHHNVVHDITDSGLIFTGATLDGTKVYNNTVVNCGMHNFHLLDEGADITLMNNIGFSYSASASVWRPSLKILDPENKHLDYNLWRNTPAGSSIIQLADLTDYYDLSTYKSATGFDAHSFNANPKFIDSANYDYHLGSTSPCRNAGVDLGLTCDIDGIPIPQGDYPDIGAYEFSEPLAIVLQPQNGQARVRDSFTFAVQAEGGIGVLSYQWYKDGTLTTDATSDTLVLASVSIENQGSYAVVVTDEVGTTVTSDSATLVVIPAPLPVTGITAMAFMAFIFSTVAARHLAGPHRSTGRWTSPDPPASRGHRTSP